MEGRPWKELEAEGVRRCCAVLYNRRTKQERQCRRRAAEGKSYCERHAWVEDRIQAEVAKLKRGGFMR